MINLVFKKPKMDITDELVYKFGLKYITKNLRTSIYGNSKVRFSIDSKVIRVNIFNEDDQGLKRIIQEYFYDKQYVNDANSKKHKYYADGVKIKFVNTHEYMSLVPYFVGKLRKIKGVSASVILKEYTEVLKEQHEVHSAIDIYSTEIGLVNNSDQMNKILDSLNCASYSALTYTEKQFMELKHYLMYILNTKKKELLHLNSFSDKEKLFLKTLDIIENTDNDKVLNMIVSLVDNEVDFNLPYLKAYNILKDTQGYSFGNKKK